MMAKATQVFKNYSSMLWKILIPLSLRSFPKQLTTNIVPANLATRALQPS
jgi:hypothetical protein